MLEHFLTFLKCKNIQQLSTLLTSLNYYHTIQNSLLKENELINQ